MANRGGSATSLIEALRCGPEGVPVREVRALDRVCLDIRQGERVGIIGRNGAGKTSLLSVLAGISKPDDGVLEIEGEVHAILTIGSVLREEATGLENIRLDAGIHGRAGSVSASHISDIVAFAELGEFIDRPVRTYSSGMKGRLAFAMAAFSRPDILLMDETLSVGDAFFSAKASARMRELARSGRILILVSHSLSSIVEMTNRCIWMDSGRIVMDGDPLTVTAAYKRNVTTSDEEALKAKFGTSKSTLIVAEGLRFGEVQLRQGGLEIATSAKAFQSISLVLRGSLSSSLSADAILTITRADGRRISQSRMSDHGCALAKGAFVLKIEFDPMILGVGLYRIEITGILAGQPVQSSAKVFEIIDDEGQFGGQPLLFDPPRVEVVDAVGEQT